jgi:3-oxoadipate enol-lactonase
MAAVADASMQRWFTPRFADTAPYRAMLMSTPAETYAGTCEALAAWDFRDRLGEIAAPTLVIAGAEDPATPPAHAELIAERIPGARLVVLEDASHFAPVEQPEAFAQAVLDHLDRVPA